MLGNKALILFLSILKGITNVPLLYGLLLAVHTNDVYYSLLAIALYPLIGKCNFGFVFVACFMCEV